MQILIFQQQQFAFRPLRNQILRLVVEVSYTTDLVEFSVAANRT